jgi:hypothetical protein
MDNDGDTEKELLNSLGDISEEADLLEEINDIQDELNSISHVYKQQLQVLSLLKDEAENEKGPSQLHYTVLQRSREIEALIYRAKTTYDGVCISLTRPRLLHSDE